MIEVLAKGLGKRVDEAVIKRWYFEEGDHVTEGDDLAELLAGKTAVMISVPTTGILAEVYFDEGETVQRDELICVIDEKMDDLKGGEDGEEDEDSRSEEGGADEADDEY